MDSAGVESVSMEERSGRDSVEMTQKSDNIDIDGDDAVNTTVTETIAVSPPSAENAISLPAAIYGEEDATSRSPSVKSENLSSSNAKEQCSKPDFSNGPVFPARHNGDLMTQPQPQSYPSHCFSNSGEVSKVNDDNNCDDHQNQLKSDKILFDYDVADESEDEELSQHDSFKFKQQNLISEPENLENKDNIKMKMNAMLMTPSDNESLAPLSASLFNCQYQTPSWIDDPLIGVPPSAMENKNTHRKTGADMRILTAYMRSLNEMRLPEAIPPEELDKYLSSFFLVVRKADGSEYEPCSLRAMLASIERYLRFKNYPLSLTRDSAFSNMRNVLKLKQQTLRSIGKGQKTPSEVTPSILAREGKIAHLFKSQEMGPYTPSSLVFTLCFYFCMYLRLRKSTENKKLLWGDIILCKDDNGREFLTFSSQMLQRTQGSSKLNLKQRTYRIWADPSCPEKDPITIYKFYEQKRPLSMNTSMAPFYLGINVLYPSQGQLWYRPAAMGINKLNEMVRQIRDMTGIRSASDFHGDIHINDKGSECDGSGQGEQSPSSESTERQEFDNEVKHELDDDFEDENNGNGFIEPPLDCSQNSERMNSMNSHGPSADSSMVPQNVYSDGDSNDSLPPQSFPSSSRAGSAGGDVDMNQEIDLSNSANSPNSPINCSTTHRDPQTSFLNGLFHPLSDTRNSDEFLSLSEAKTQLMDIVKKMEASEVIHFDGWLKKVSFRPDPFSGQIVCKESDEPMKVTAWNKPVKQGANITLNISLSQDAINGEGPITVTAQTMDSNGIEAPSTPSAINIQSQLHQSSATTKFNNSNSSLSSKPSLSSLTATSSPLNTVKVTGQQYLSNSTAGNMSPSIDKPLNLATGTLTRTPKSSMTSSSSSHHLQNKRIMPTNVATGMNGLLSNLMDQPTLNKRLRMSTEQAAEAYTNASLMASLSMNERLRLQLMQAGYGRTAADYNLDPHTQSLLELASSEAFRSQFMQHYGIKTESNK